MGEPSTDHPYRPEPARPPQQPRHVPWIVRVNILFGENVTGALFMLAAASWLMWNGPRRDLGSTPPILATIFVFVPLTLTSAGLGWWLIAKRRRSLRLLQLGRVAFGTLVDKHQPEGDRREVLRFSFEDRGEQYVIETRSEDPRKLLDDPREQLVFMPERPDLAELLDGMPGQPRIRPDGTIAVRGHIVSGVVALVFLAALIGANVIGIYNWLR